jgi:hypothetical protein
MELDSSVNFLTKKDDGLTALVGLQKSAVKENKSAEEEEEEELELAHALVSSSPALDFFAEYSAAKERHDSGISGSPVSTSDCEPLGNGADGGGDAADVLGDTVPAAQPPASEPVTEGRGRQDGGERSQGAGANGGGGSPAKRAAAAVGSGTGQLRKRPGLAKLPHEGQPAQSDR